MINEIKGWDSIKSGGDYETLEKGGYVVKILNAKQEVSRHGNEMLVIFFDIKEGEKAGFFKRRYDSQKADNPDAKWQGTYYATLPTEKMTEKGYTFSAQRLKRLAEALEESNVAYKWDWDENKLKGLTVGAVFGREEYEGNDGKRRWSTKVRYFCSQDEIDNKRYKIPEDKPLPDHNSISGSYTASGFQEIDSAIEGDSDLPF